MPNTLAIGVCCDHRFALGAWITIWSTWRHLPAGRVLRVFFLTPFPQAPSIRRVSALAAKLPRLELHVLTADCSRIAGLPEGRHLPREAYLRLLLPELLPKDDMILYLDCDLLVCGDLSELAHESETFGMVRDFGTWNLSAHVPYIAAFGSDTDNQPSFNSGLISFRPGRWRDLLVTEHCIEFLTQHQASIRHGDQDALNVVLRGEIQQVDFEWNVQVGALTNIRRRSVPGCEQLRADARRLLREPKVLHFIGAAKPWNDAPFVPGAARYRRALLRSGWFAPSEQLPWAAHWLVNSVRRTLERRGVLSL